MELLALIANLGIDWDNTGGGRLPECLLGSLFGAIHVHCPSECFHHAPVHAKLHMHRTCSVLCLYVVTILYASAKRKHLEITQCASCISATHETKLNIHANNLYVWASPVSTGNRELYRAFQPLSVVLPMHCALCRRGTKL